MVRRLERDSPELLSFLAFPRHLWREPRPTNVIDSVSWKCDAETRAMVCFVNIEGVDHFIYSPFQRFNLELKTPTLSVLHTHLDSHPVSPFGLSEEFQWCTMETREGCSRKRDVRSVQFRFR
jgi:hypothetical protein